MKILLLALFLLPAMAFAESKDHLARFGGAKGFCNILTRAQRLPENNTSCGAILSLKLKAEDFHSIDLSNFGQIRDVIHLSELDEVIIITILSLDDLEAIRADERILNLAPDFPMGGNGSFTVRN